MTLGAFFAGLFPFRTDQDEWWHVKTGKALWDHWREHGFGFPQYDAFTFTGAETPWVNHEWLAQAIFYACYALGGLQGAIAFKAAILSVSIVLLALYIRRLGVDWALACVGGLLALLAMQGTITLRPPIFTYLMIPLFLHLILSMQRKRRFWLMLACATTLEVVWVNLHGGALIGIILMGFWWTEELCARAWRWLKENARFDWRGMAPSSLALGAITLASLVNPFTYHIHLLPFDVLTDTFLLQNLGELQPPQVSRYGPFMVMILLLFLLPCLAARPMRLRDALGIVFFGQQAFSHLRHIPLFGLFAVPPLTAALSEWRDRLLEAAQGAGVLREAIRAVLRWRLDALTAFILIALAFGAAPGMIWHRNAYDLPVYLFEGGFDRRTVPNGAVNFILRNDLQGPMLNGHNFSGFLIYHLAPERLKLFTDSRFELWGSQYVKEEIAVASVAPWPNGAYDAEGRWYDFPDARSRDDLREAALSGHFPDLHAWYESGLPYWQYVLEKYEFNFILFFDNRRIGQVLQEEDYGWRLVYRNEGYMIWLRDHPRNRGIIERHALSHRDIEVGSSGS